MKRVAILIMCCLLFLSGCSFNPFDNGPSLSFTEAIVTLEYGAKTNLESYISSSKYDELTISAYDPYRVGIQDITYTAIRNGKTKDFTLQIKNEDTQYPKFTKKAEELLILEGSSFDIKNYFQAHHAVDGDVAVTLKEAIDVNTPGVYIVTAQARSKFGNESIMNFTLAIKSQAEYEAIVANVEPPVSSPAPDEKQPQPTVPNEPEAPTAPSQPTPTQPEPVPPVLQDRPSNRQYLFSDGFNIQTGLDACIAYITPYASFERSCIDIRNDDGFGIGYEAHFN